jgi:hypothetical protein
VSLFCILFKSKKKKASPIKRWVDLCKHVFWTYYIERRVHVCRGSSISVTTRYELDGPRIEAWCRFYVPFRPAFRPNHCPVQSTPDLSGVKRPEHGADQPPHFSAGLLMGWIHTSAFPLCQHRHVIRWPLQRILGDCYDWCNSWIDSLESQLLKT